MDTKRTRLSMFMIALLALSTFSMFSPLLPTHAQPNEEVFAFVVISDPRTSRNQTDFEDDLQQIKYWIDNPTSDIPAPRFMEVTGDFDHSTDTEVSIDTVLGTDFIWFPTIGNHELDDIADFEYCRDTIFPTLPWIVDTGPAGSIGTSYSWDYGNAHFTSVNCYWDGTTVSGADHATNGDIPAELCDWVEADLAASGKTHKFVFVHEAAFPEVRHVGDSLDQYPANRDAFVTMLDNKGVEVLFVGHDHYYHHDTSSEYPLLGDVHQVSSGQIGRGSSGEGATIIYVLVSGSSATYKVYRSTTNYPFTLSDEWTISRSPPEPPTEPPTNQPNVPRSITLTLDVSSQEIDVSSEAKKVTVQANPITSDGATVHFTYSWNVESGELNVEQDIFIDVGTVEWTLSDEGGHSIICTARSIGYSDGVSSASVTAIPEFHHSHIISLVFLLLILFVIKKGKPTFGN